MSLVKVLPIKKQYNRTDNFVGSLAAQGYVMIPGVQKGIVPSMDEFGNYYTGFNTDSRRLRVLKEIDPKEYEKEVKALNKERADLEAFTGEKLDPKSKYYRDLEERGGLRVGNEGVILDTTKPADRITLAWLKECYFVAPSFEQWTVGGENIHPDMEFYIADEGEETKVKFKNKQRTNAAIIKLDQTIGDIQLKWGKLLGLQVNDLSNDEDIYNKIDEHIKTSKNGLAEFERVVALSDAMVDIKVLVKDGLLYNVIRNERGGAIMFGNDTIAKNQADLEEFLLDSANTIMLSNIKDAVKDKKKQQLLKNRS